MHLFHKWAPWSNVYVARIEGKERFAQSRYCRKCRQTQVREVLANT